MYALKNVTDSVKDFLLKAKEVANEILVNLGETKEDVLIPRTDNVFADESRKGKIYILSNGNLLLTNGDNDLFVLEPGDVIGIPEHFGVSLGRIRSEFAVHAKEFDAGAFFGCMDKTPEMQNLFSQFFIYNYLAMINIAVSAMQGEKVFSPSVRSYESGQTIISQGSPGSDVYTLLEGGHADVMVNGVKVGDIKEDQLFGLFAALTDTPRTASVIASKPSLAVVVSKEDFLELIQHMPHLALQALTDLAHTVTDLNTRVVSLSKDIITKEVI
ncbi:MAG: cyclic nucleotide-binding domain-containing protein [SAR324 cluster bacterium]|uniref:Cyclic nucleotide-binding domain-containing protein n=1 Tax=SAR324 cluster bacterium TaxID=2024889 RepID=A0A7X9FTY5_9DELT|nr:cyclic nucleotide-binding domain-containing protein [SAR324 cluster bacterium]